MRAGIRAAFEEAHRLRFGFVTAEKAVVVASVEVEGIAGSKKIPPIPPFFKGGSEEAAASHRVFMRGEWRDTPFYQRDGLQIGETISGPAVILESTGTIVIEPGWSVQLTDRAIW